MDIHGLFMDIHGLSMEFFGSPMDISGFSMDTYTSRRTHDSPWWGSVEIVTCFSDRWECSGQLGGAPGSMKDYFKHDSRRLFEVVLTFVGSIQDRSASNLGPYWTTFGYLSLSKTTSNKKLVLYSPPGNYVISRF